ncbi:long-chain fatty acid--CoA ligase [Streptomyces triticagri]|uniref:Long-chain fatty acid--CoA ligase n=1 Tax=Streptomyces triticagri TaxID=2293568 RepID=A0A372M6P9_9ACTN|nr:class I adenylate-forming enzyme family protein [Streptomyces triticagri]RFU86628.1 long-chain fatty acid--CoA ligase [Streptomyces triticagri]
MCDPITEAAAAGLFGGSPFPTGVGYPSSILDHLDRHVTARGDAPYLTVVADGSTSLTYRELDRYSRRIAYWLHTECAVAGGTAVGLALVNDLDSVLALFGVLRAGTPALILNPADPASRLAEQTAALGVSLVLHGRGAPDVAIPDAVRLPDPARLPDPPDEHVFPEIRSADDALYFGTSGSTAASKLVAQTHANGAANARAVMLHHGLEPGDTFLGCLPIHHVNGVHFTLFGTLAAGAHAVLAARFDPFSYPALITEHRPRVASVVPSILDALTVSWRRPVLPPEFCYFVSAAAPLTAATARAVHKRLGSRVLQGYGLTETTNFSMTMPRGLSDSGYRRLMIDVAIPSVGVAVHGNEVAVLRSDGTRAEPGEIGEICMRGHNVMSRYANNSEATDEAFQGGWFHSQDLGYAVVDPELGRPVFFLTGRIKNIAKVRGETVSLEEMERVLRELPGVQDAACAALPDPLLGETVVAAVAAPGEVADAQLRAHVAGHFAAAVLPTRYVRVEKVPRTATGKVLRLDLRRLLASSD